MLSYNTLKANAVAQSSSKKSFSFCTIFKLCLCFLFIVGLISLIQTSSAASQQRRLKDNDSAPKGWNRRVKDNDFAPKEWDSEGCLKLGARKDGTREDLECVFATKKARNSFWKASAMALAAIATGAGCFFPNGCALWAGYKIMVMARDKTWIRYTFRKSKGNIVVKLQYLEVYEDLSENGTWTRKFKEKTGQTNQYYARLKMIGKPDKKGRNSDEMKHRVKLVFSGMKNAQKVCDRWIYYNIPPLASTIQVANENKFQEVLKNETVKTIFNLKRQAETYGFKTFKEITDKIREKNKVPKQNE